MTVLNALISDAAEAASVFNSEVLTRREVGDRMHNALASLGAHFYETGHSKELAEACEAADPSDRKAIVLWINKCITGLKARINGKGEVKLTKAKSFEAIEGAKSDDDLLAPLFINKFYNMISIDKDPKKKSFDCFEDVGAAIRSAHKKQMMSRADMIENDYDGDSITKVEDDKWAEFIKLAKEIGFNLSGKGKK